jgi:hypothetical protein
MIIDNNEIIVTGKLIKTARIKYEWDDDIQCPESLIENLKKSRINADIFTFWQRLPDTQPKFNYYMEWDNVAALRISSYDHWWNKQIDSKTRNVIRKAEKKGVVIKIVDFDDEFVKGIQDIYNETPIRQGKLFWHYGKTFDTVKKANAENLERSDFIGAYYNNEMIGFIKLVYSGRIGRLEQILSKISHRDKSPTNALIAKAVEICNNKNVPYLVYAKWPQGTLADFKRNNAFEKIDLPKYYVPLTIKGTMALKFHLHHGISGLLPEKLTLYLINLRSNWYSKKYKNLSNI